APPRSRLPLILERPAVRSTAGRLLLLPARLRTLGFLPRPADLARGEILLDRGVADPDLAAPRAGPPVADPTGGAELPDGGAMQLQLHGGFLDGVPAHRPSRISIPCTVLLASHSSNSSSPVGSSPVHFCGQVFDSISSRIRATSSGLRMSTSAT